MTERPLDRMDQIAACLRCIADLMMPEPDLSTVDRGDLASALGFLMDEYRAARESLPAAREPSELRHAA